MEERAAAAAASVGYGDNYSYGRRRSLSPASSCRCRRRRRRPPRGRRRGRGGGTEHNSCTKPRRRCGRLVVLLLSAGITSRCAGCSSEGNDDVCSSGNSGKAPPAAAAGPPVVERRARRRFDLINKRSPRPTDRDAAATKGNTDDRLTAPQGRARIKKPASKRAPSSVGAPDDRPAA